MGNLHGQNFMGKCLCVNISCAKVYGQITYGQIFMGKNSMGKLPWVNIPWAKMIRPIKMCTLIMCVEKQMCTLGIFLFSNVDFKKPC